MQTPDLSLLPRREIALVILSVPLGLAPLAVALAAPGGLQLWAWGIGVVLCPATGYWAIPRVLDRLYRQS